MARFQDDTLVLAFNNASLLHKRTPLWLSTSRDAGHHWTKLAVLEDNIYGEFSYPTVVQGVRVGAGMTQAVVAYTVGEHDLPVGAPAAQHAMKKGENKVLWKGIKMAHVTTGVPRLQMLRKGTGKDAAPRPSIQNSALKIPLLAGACVALANPAPPGNFSSFRIHMEYEDPTSPTPPPAPAPPRRPTQAPRPPRPRARRPRALNEDPPPPPPRAAPFRFWLTAQADLGAAMDADAWNTRVRHRTSPG